MVAANAVAASQRVVVKRYQYLRSPEAKRIDLHQCAVAAAATSE
jgi:hypothetical protein